MGHELSADRRHRLAPLALLLIALAARIEAADLLIRDCRLIDGTGAPPQEHTRILVRDGRVAAIGRDLTAADVPTLDAGGATVLPGLIDTHVHLAVVPGAAYRHDPPEVVERLRRQHLRAYLAAGVTTVLDTGIPLPLAREIHAWLAAGHPGPRFLTLGTGFTAPSGYGAAHHAAVSTPAEVEAHLDRLVALGVVGVKVFIEPGFGPRAHWPVPTPEVREAIVRGATRRRLPIYVHANREPAKTIALDMQAHAIVHAGFYDAPPSDAFVARLATSGTYLMTTFSVMDAELARFHPERLDDPLVQRVVPATEIATARDPAAGRFLVSEELGAAVPWLPRLLHGMVGRIALDEASFHERLASSQRAVARVAAAGVPIVVGSDAGNWDILPYQFHAASTPREIELLGQAGVAPAAALAASTRVPAGMLGLDGEIGTIAVGTRADMVLVVGDPLQDLRALRTVRWTVRDGVACTPAEWMAE